MSEFEKAEIDKMIEKKVLELKQTKWTAYIVFVPKKEIMVRFHVDYRKRDTTTKRDLCLISQMKNEMIS